jgi:GT2 family glycosyltransferase
VLNAAERPGINVARNAGVRAAAGELLCFCDADDVVEPDWVTEVVEAARHFDVVGGRLDEETLNAEGSTAVRPRLPTDDLPVALGFLPFAVGANFAVWRDVLAELGDFDEAYLCGNDDVDFCFHAQLRGFRLGYAPQAVVRYRHRDSGRELFRQFRNYGRAEPLLYQRYRSQGMPPSPIAPTVRRWLRLALDAPALLGSPVRRGAWLADVGFTVGRIEGSLRHRVPYL